MISSFRTAVMISALCRSEKMRSNIADNLQHCLPMEKSYPKQLQCLPNNIKCSSHADKLCHFLCYHHQQPVVGRSWTFNLHSQVPSLLSLFWSSAFFNWNTWPFWKRKLPTATPFCGSPESTAVSFDDMISCRMEAMNQRDIRIAHFPLHWQQTVTGQRSAMHHIVKSSIANCSSDHSDVPQEKGDRLSRWDATGAALKMRSYHMENETARKTVDESVQSVCVGHRRSPGQPLCASVPLWVSFYQPVTSITVAGACLGG